MARNVELAVRMSVDTAGVAQEFDAAGDAARRLGSDVDAASRQADTAARRFDTAADATDHLDDRAGKATSSLGALSSGFELIGAEKYAGALQGAALATDFFSGVGELSTLVLESQRLTMLRGAIASKVHAAATWIATGAQKALNLAMRANPIGIVITLILALVAGIVLAYKRSETFRAIVQAAMRAAVKAVGWVVDKVSALVDWFKDRMPGAANTMRDVVRAAFNALTTPIRTVVNLVQGFIDKVRAGLGWVERLIGRTQYASNLGQGVKGAINNAAGEVAAGVGGGNGAGGGRGGAQPSSAQRSSTNVNVNFNGLVTDPNAAAREVRRVVGRYVTLTAAPS